MTSAGNKAIILAGVEKARNINLFQNKWWSDESLVSALMHRLSVDVIQLDDISTQLSIFNSTISRAPKYDCIDFSFPINSSGDYRMKLKIVDKSGKKCTRNFYYFCRNKEDPPLPLTCTRLLQQWIEIITKKIKSKNIDKEANLFTQQQI